MGPKVKVSCEHKRVRIQTLFSEGYGTKEICQKVQVSPSTVRRWRNKKQFTDRKRSARPRVLSPTTKRQIKSKMYRKCGASVRKTARILNSTPRYMNKNKNISKSTVHNYLKTTKWGKTAYRSQKKTLLSKKNVQDRLKFGQLVEETGFLTPGTRGQKLRANILFTDETWIELHGQGHSQNRRYRTEERIDVPPILRPKHSLKIMVAGGFCAGGVTQLHVVPQGQTINANYYQTKILPTYTQAMSSGIFSSRNNIVFQQDGAPAHTAKSTMKILEDEFETVWGKGVWPGNSPDLNPIENLWSILKDSAYQDPLPTTRQELQARFQTTWNSLPVDLLQKLAQSFKTRVDQMMTNDGGHTTY